MYVHDAFIRPYAGDMLVVIVLYTAVRILWPVGLRLLWLYVFLFAAAVECMQYFNFVERLGLGGSRFMRVLLGSTFDLKDIGCYAVGALAIAAFEYAAEGRRARHILESGD